MKLSYLILASCFLLCCFGTSHAQFGTVSFPNEIKLDQIKAENLNGISFQAIKRKDLPKKYYKSTAFFISKNFVLTSAHNLKTIKSHVVTKISFYPSRKGRVKPYGSIILNVDNENYFKAVNRSFFKFRWRKRPHDMALIYVPDSIIAKNEKLQELAYLPILENPKELHKGDTIYCAGYPATGVYAGQVVMTVFSSTIKHIYKNHFSHRIKTFRGNSGSPIMVKRDGKYYVIGINSIHHYGTWLNKKRQLLIKEWMKELEEKNK